MSWNDKPLPQTLFVTNKTLYPVHGFDHITAKAICKKYKLYNTTHYYTSGGIRQNRLYAEVENLTDYVNSQNIKKEKIMGIKWYKPLPHRNIEERHCIWEARIEGLPVKDNTNAHIWIFKDTATHYTVASQVFDFEENLPIALETTMKSLPRLANGHIVQILQDRKKKAQALIDIIMGTPSNAIMGKSTDVVYRL